MTALESLVSEYNSEMRSTRRMLERIPPDRLEWRPHVKSFSAGDLAAHIVDSVDWLEHIFTAMSSTSIQGRTNRLRATR